MSYTIPQRVLVIESYYESNRSVTETLRKLRYSFGTKRPTKATILRIVKNFKERGTVADRPGRGTTRNVRTTDNIERVHQSVLENPTTSIRHRAKQLNLSPTSVYQIMKKDLHLFAYHEEVDEEDKSIKKKTGRKKDQVENEYSEEPPNKKRNEQKKEADGAVNDDVTKNQSDSNPKDSIEDSEEGATEEEKNAAK